LRKNSPYFNEEQFIVLTYKKMECR